MYLFSFDINNLQIRPSNYFSIHSNFSAHTLNRLISLTRASTTFRRLSEVKSPNYVSIQKSLQLVFSHIFLSFVHFHSSALVLLSFLFSVFLNILERERMGRFKCLVKSEEGMASFRAQYRIPPNVNLRYCEEGEWFE